MRRQPRSSEITTNPAASLALFYYSPAISRTFSCNGADRKNRARVRSASTSGLTNRI